MVTVKTQQKQSPFSTKPLGERRQAGSADSRSLAVNRDAVKRGGGSVRYPDAASCRSTSSLKSRCKGVISSVLARYVCICFFTTPRAKPGASAIPAPCAFFEVQSVSESRILSSNRSREQGNSCKAANPVQKRKCKIKTREGNETSLLSKGKKNKIK